MKPIYIYFSFRHFKKENRMVCATAAYADYEGKKLLGIRSVEVKPWDNNNYVKMIQSYANALNYVYDKQDTLKSYGYDSVILVTFNKVLYGWLLNNECNSHTKWFKYANKPFRNGAKKEITLSVGLGNLSQSDLAYKYCKLEMVDAQLKQTYRGVKIMSKEEIEAEAEAAAKLNENSEEAKTLSLDELLAMDDMRADISFDGFIQE